MPCLIYGRPGIMLMQLEARRQISAQHLQTECEALRAELDAATTTFKHVEECASYRQTLEKLSERVYAARSEVDNLRKAEALFGLEASEFEELEGVCVVFDRLNEVSCIADCCNVVIHQLLRRVITMLLTGSSSSSDPTSISYRFCSTCRLDPGCQN